MPTPPPVACDPLGIPIGNLAPPPGANDRLPVHRDAPPRSCQRPRHGGASSKPRLNLFVNFHCSGVDEWGVVLQEG
jgi:hypothetical protein